MVAGPVLRMLGRTRQGQHTLLKPSGLSPKGTANDKRAVRGEFDDTALRGRGDAKSEQRPQPGANNLTLP